MKVVARAERQRAERRLGGLLRRHRDRRRQRVEVHDEQVLLELLRERDEFAARVHHHAAAVEDEFVVPADLVDVHDRQLEPPRLVGEQFPPDLLFAERERRGGEVEDDLRAFAQEHRDRVEVIPRAQAALDPPAVLADGDAERAPAERRGVRLTARLEVAVLVEHVVGREQRLVVHRDHAPVADERGGIVQRLALAGLVPRDEADDRRQRKFAREPVERVEPAGDEPGMLDEVARRIAHDGHLRKDGEFGPERRRAPGGIEDLRRVPAEVAHGRIDLRQCNFHGACFLIAFSESRRR